MAICMNEVIKDGIATRTMMSAPDGFIEFTGAIKYSNRYNDPRMFVECVFEQEKMYTERPWYMLWFPRSVRSMERVTRWRIEHDFDIYTDTIVNC